MAGLFLCGGFEGTVVVQAQVLFALSSCLTWISPLPAKVMRRLCGGDGLENVSLSRPL